MYVNFFCFFKIRRITLDQFFVFLQLVFLVYGTLFGIYGLRKLTKKDKKETPEKTPEKTP